MSLVSPSSKDLRHVHSTNTHNVLPFLNAQKTFTYCSVSGLSCSFAGAMVLYFSGICVVPLFLVSQLLALPSELQGGEVIHQI